MPHSGAKELNWNIKTVLIAAAFAVWGFLIALALQKAGVWPDWPYSQFVFGGLCGATAVHRLYPGRPWIVLFVFGTVMAVLLGVGTFLFAWYVLGASI